MTAQDDPAWVHLIKVDLAKAEAERDGLQAECDARAISLGVERALVKDAEAERDRLQHILDCANTPLMADVLAERDAFREALGKAAEFLHAAQNNHTVDWSVVEIVDAALAPKASGPVKRPCPDCGGLGHVDYPFSPCPKCHGSGDAK